MYVLVYKHLFKDFVSIKYLWKKKKKVHWVWGFVWLIFKLDKDTSFYRSSFVNKIIQEKEIYKQCFSGLLCLSTDVTQQLSVVIVAGPVW